MQKNLQRLAITSALRDGRDSINKYDFLNIYDIAKYVNLDAAS